MTELLSRNTKMMKTSKKNDHFIFYDFGITPGKTCPMRGDCDGWCYGKRGRYTFEVVKDALEWRYQQTLLDNFVDIMIWTINEKIKDAAKKGKEIIIRIHSVGDVYSKEYGMKWMKIISSCNCRFYTYTKCVSMMKDILKDISPDNLTVIFSHGGLEDNLITFDDRQSKVIMKGQSIPEGWTDATDNDMVAIEKRYVALPYH